MENEMKVSAKKIFRQAAGILMIMIAVFGFTLKVINSNDDYEIRMPDSAWVIRQTGGERMLYNESTGEIIYKALTYDENGEVTEIPLAEYVIFRNTTPFAYGEFEEYEQRKVSIEEKHFITETGYIGTFWAAPQKSSADFAGVCSYTMGDKTFDLPDGYTHHTVDIKLIELISEDTYLLIPDTDFRIKISSDIFYENGTDEGGREIFIRELRLK